MDLCVFLTDRCTLQCDYCMILVNKGPAHSLSTEQVVKGSDYYLAKARGEDRCVIYLGGEPLLRPKVLVEASAEIRRAHPDVKQHVYTNGIHLTPALYEALSKNEVDVILSLDGWPRTNDLHRFFPGNSRRSSCKEALEAMKRLPVGDISVNMVLGVDSIDDLTENFSFFRRAGFRKIDFNPETNKSRLSRWDDDALQRLGDSVRGLCRHLENSAVDGKLEISLPTFDFIAQIACWSQTPPWWQALKAVNLGADGRFYPCESLLGFPFETLDEFAFGDTESGLNWSAAEALMKPARSFISERFPGRRHFSCPYNTFFFGKRTGIDPEELISREMRIFEALAEPILSFWERHPNLLPRMTLTS